MVLIMYKYHLSDVEWGEFFISEIFSFTERGRRLKIDDRKNGNIPFVTAGGSDNGISSFISNLKQKLYNKAITIDMFGNAFFQKGWFKCDDNITILQNDLFSNSIYIFLTSRLNILNEKYSYGKQLRPNRLVRDKIMLPAKEDGNPNWHFMEEYVKERENKQRHDLKEYYKNRLLDLVICPEVLTDVEWGEFFVSDVFDTVQRGKRLTKANQIDGGIPYISSTALNNGVDDFIGNTENVRKSNNNLTLANSGSVGACFYHNYEYIASDHVTSLKLLNGNDTVYKFISVILERLEEKYSFNREINDTRIKREKLLLPIDENGDPNWTYMENFIKNIEQKQIKSILKYLD